jgi:hypothetical protein
MYDRFALSDLRIIKTNSDMPLVKMYMFPLRKNSTYLDYKSVNKQTFTRHIFSLHSIGQTEDKGLAVMDAKCWQSMVNFFTSMKNHNEIKVEKVSSSNDVSNETVKSIANLNII